MRNYLFLFLFSIPLANFAQGTDSLITEQPTSLDKLQTLYSAQLDSLAYVRQQAELQATVGRNLVAFNPYMYRILTPGTMYYSVLQRTMGLNWESEMEESTQNHLWLDNHMLLESSDGHLMQMYVNHPSLIQHTEAEIQQQPKLLEETKQPIKADSKLTEMAMPVDLGNDIAEPVEVKAHKPNFWTIRGNGSLQFQQSYFSENWYQGGENNYAAQAQFTIEANYDNKKKLQWNNRLEMKTHMQTSSDTVHNPRVTSSLMRATSRIGYKAAKNWNYTGEATANTQIFKNFKTNSKDYTSGFAAPLYFQLSVGMEYKFKSKKGKFSGTLYLSPVAYNMTYVNKAFIDDKLFVGNYGLEEGKNMAHNFGPNAKFEFDWQIVKNVKWNSKMYYFTNFEYVRYQWENKFSFTINKYLNANLFVYPRFDDSSIGFKSDNGSYWMFQEWLSLGLSYDF